MELMHAGVSQKMGARPDRQNKPEFVGGTQASPDPRLIIRSLTDSGFELSGKGTALPLLPPHRTGLAACHRIRLMPF